MARVKNPPFLRRLREALEGAFPPPDTVDLKDHDGIIGVVTSTRFESMETLDRQNVIGEIVDSHLTTDERRRVLVIVGVTPDEETGYLAGKAPAGRARRSK